MTTPKGEREPFTPSEAQAVILRLIEDGYLVGVEVFGTDECCMHGPHYEDVANDPKWRDCVSVGFGLCDVFGPWSVGSDCNRAERVLLRPADVIDFDAVATLRKDERLWRGENKYPPPHFGRSTDA